MSRNLYTAGWQVDFFSERADWGFSRQSPWLYYSYAGLSLLFFLALVVFRGGRPRTLPFGAAVLAVTWALLLLVGHVDVGLSRGMMPTVTALFIALWASVRRPP